MDMVIQNIIDKFSTYIQVKQQGNNYFVPIYLTDVKLKKTISSHLQSFTNDKEEDCIRHFLRSLKKSNYQDVTTKQLIVCYLQKACWYASQKVSRELSQTSNLNLHYSHEDCFMIACELALQPRKLLDNFNFETKVSVQTYVQTVLSRMIKNQIVTQLKAKSLKFSDQGLLKNTSKSQLDESLSTYGINQTKMTEYGIFFQSFKDLYYTLLDLSLDSSNNSDKNLISTLNQAQTKALNDRIQQQFKRLGLPQKNLSTEEIQQNLSFCVQVIRNYQNRTFVDLDNVHQDLTTTANSLDLLSQSEEYKQFEQLRNIVVKEFEPLDLAHKVILLWLGLEINQADFRELLQCEQQFQVSRQLTKYLKNILKAIVQKVLTNSSQLTNKELNKLCQENTKVIKDYLQLYSQDYFINLLMNIVNSNDDLIKKLILEISNNYFIIIVDLLKNKIDEKLEIKIQQFACATQRLNYFVFQTLSNNKALLISQQKIEE